MAESPQSPIQQPQKAPMGGLARKLVQLGLVTEADASITTEESVTQAVPFISKLVEKKLIEPRKLASVCSQEFGLPLFDLGGLDYDYTPKEIIKAPLIIKNHAFPLFKRGNRLFIAMSDPTNLRALDEMKYQANMNTEAILVEEDKLVAAIEKILAAQEVASLGSLEDADLEGLDITSEDESAGPTTFDPEDAPIIRFVNKVLLDAINIGASDVHFEPYEKTFRIRFRQDGILYEHATPPITLAGRISVRLKVMARLDISERRLPQDGRFKMRLSNSRSIDFRISTCPTLFGEKIVMRVLDPMSAKLGVDSLGLFDFQQELFLKALKKPQGMILVTGPTGSGKTITLYTALNILNTPELNISTCEDPIEINLPGVNQLNVNVKAGLTFAGALRAFLRQDPDVIMVGEIRDLETAEIGVKAAQTGHLVLSTIHTNSAFDSIARLMNMGIPSYNLATSIALVIGQRLARKLCLFCRKEEEIPGHALLEAGFTEIEVSAQKAQNIKLYGPVGCDKCKDGYRGRTGLYEVMPISLEMGKLIMKGVSAIELGKLAQEEGVWTLRRAALRKFQEGITSLKEINRVTKD
jgi:type IV pilus assembly protein PilB